MEANKPIPPPLTIRPATEADIPLLLHYIKQIAIYEKMLDDVQATEENLREWFFVRQQVEGLILEAAGQDIGFCIFYTCFSTFSGRGGIYLEDIYLEPAHRNHGYGKQVLRYLAQTAEKRGCSHMEWSCLDWNEPSLAFYRKLGAKSKDHWIGFRLNGAALADLGKEEA